MSDERVIADRTPIGVEVEAGKTYFWCACGRSQSQPFCDGSHKGTSITPFKWEARETKIFFLCRCKHTAGAPLCDGSHKRL